MIYLDNAATTKVSEPAAKAAFAAMTEEYMNASAAYAQALDVEQRVESVRARIAQMLQAQKDEVIFTSGGTESNNIALWGTLRATRLAQPKVIVSAIEHPAVIQVAAAMEKQGCEVVRLSVDTEGYAREELLEELLDERTLLVSVMQVNNEVGTVQRVERIQALVKKCSPQAYFHCDGIQAFGKLPAPRVDMFSVSGHKLHAPKGVGALLLRKGVKHAGGQLGGGQEGGLRSGTLNTPGILALGAVLPSAQETEKNTAHMQECKQRLLKGIAALEGVYINGPNPEAAAPHILNLSFEGINGETLMNALAEKDILISRGSACAARKAGKNYVLEAMGLSPQRIQDAVRISLSRYNTLEEMGAAAEAITGTVKQLRMSLRRR